jgi:glycosyltransferase involved in cell wall biosynthesis
VLNEERSLPLVLADLPASSIERVIVVDNGSTDRTLDVARERAGSGRLPRVELVREPERGYGSACLAGIEHLRRTGPPSIVVFIDGDYSDHGEELPSLVGPIAAGEADFVLGSRALGVSEPGAVLPQARLGNAFATRLIRLLTGFRYTDLGPFRAIRWESLETLGMRDRGFGWTCEMQIKALRAGLRIREVPVSYRRRVGVSKIAGTLSGTVRAGAKIVFWALRARGSSSRQPG